MAENWYMRMSEVQGKLAEYHSAGLVKSEPKLADVLHERLLQMEMLRDTIVKKERNFFGKLDATRPYQDDPKMAMYILRQKLNEWNSGGAKAMVSNNSIQLVLDILTSGEYRRMSYGELQEIISEYLNEDPTFTEEAAQNVISELIAELNEVLEKNGQQKLPQKKRGGGTYAYFTIINNNGKLSVEISSDIRSDLKSKMKRTFQQVLQNHNKSTAQFSDATRNAALVQKEILKNITNPRIAEIIKRELTPGRIEGYNLARDFNVIKGFLGEVYWSAFFTYLGADTLPAGDLKDRDTHQSIGIDLLVNGYGFQVKNFNIKADGSIAFGTRNGYKMAGTFIKDRAAIDGELGQLLLDLYGSYAYNIDVSDGEFAQTREQLETILTKDASEIFEHYIDRIIRLDAEQSHELMDETESIVPNQKLLFNTFFVIGDRIVPSSVILTEIINNIRYGSKNPAINFEIVDLKAKEDAPKYDENILWQQPKLANYTGISYTIDFNINNILKKAYDSAFA